MQWFNRPYPKDGDTRIVTRFLLFPYRLNDETRWLETVRVKQQYTWSWYEGWWYGKEWVE